MMQSIPSIALKHIRGFNVMGLSVTTKNDDEFNEKTAKIPSLWQQFYSSDLVIKNACIFGVYSGYDTDEHGLYTVTVGITSDESQPKRSSVKVQTGNYLIFQGQGPMPSTVIETWKQVWTYFEATDECQRNFISDFESYTGPEEVAIYIGIK